MAKEKESIELEAVREEPEKSAKAAGLRYVSDEQPGIRREKTKDGFVFIGADGKEVADEKTLARVRKLTIPPAWMEVWICAKENGHLQATGRDARGRKQYRYHPRWREVRDEVKFERMVAFGKALPRIRERVEEDLRRRKLDRRRVLAAIVRLLEVSLIRVGNDEYERENRSFGLTTMRDRHVEIHGAEAEFEYLGKAGKKHRVTLRDRRLVKIIERCRDLPGYRLFQYLDENGEKQAVDSGEVNEYLREISGADFTAKDFRTWAGTVLAATALREFERFDSAAQGKRNVVKAVEDVARRLGNTPSICRKCYIHPGVIDAYLDGDLAVAVKEEAGRELRENLRGLPAEEAAVLVFLEERLAG